LIKYPLNATNLFAHLDQNLALYLNMDLTPQRHWLQSH